MPNPDEQRRLASLHELLVLDTPPEPVFDAITAMAAQVCQVPIALISLVDADRQWFKSNVGLPGVSETPREVAFCHHAVAQGSLLEVPDARADPRFAGNRLVTGAPDIRFYAGAPIATATGHAIGTVCVIDRRPRQLSAEQRQVLEGLARIASLTLADRRCRESTAQALAESEARHRAIVEDQSEMISVSDAEGTLRFVNHAYAQHFGLEPQDLIGHKLIDFVDEADRPAVTAHLERARRSPEAVSGVNRMRSAGGRARWVSWVNRPLRRAGTDGVSIQSVGRDITEQREAEEALRAALAERETLLKEVYHRVKNNLQVVQSLLNLQHRSLADPHARQALEDSSRRLRAMALVHEKLYQTGNLDAMPLRPYTGELLRQIGEAMAASSRGVQLQAEVPDRSCRPDSAIPYGLIVTELVSNALEHAFVGRAQGLVRVELLLEDGVPTLTVRDDGQGLPAGFDPAATSSMGLQLVGSLAQQLGGRLSARPGPGGCFSVSLLRL